MQVVSGDRRQNFPATKNFFEACGKIIFEGIGLDTMTRSGPGQTKKNLLMRQSKCGETREWFAQNATKHNSEYVGVNPRNTSKMCGMCG